MTKKTKETESSYGWFQSECFYFLSKTFNLVAVGRDLCWNNFLKDILQPTSCGMSPLSTSNLCKLRYRKKVLQNFLKNSFLRNGYQNFGLKRLLSLFELSLQMTIIFIIKIWLLQKSRLRTYRKITKKSLMIFSKD